MLTRKFYGEEDILRIFNESLGVNESAENPIEDIDLESMSDMEKIKLAHEILKDCDGSLSNEKKEVSMKDVISGLKALLEVAEEGGEKEEEESEEEDEEEEE
jgi:hypothetical protein